MKDSDNVARLEALRPRYDRLREARIRADADVERFEAELLKASEAAVRVAGTDDEQAIREAILANYEANTKAVDEFEALIAGIEKELEEIERQG